MGCQSSKDTTNNTNSIPKSYPTSIPANPSPVHQSFSQDQAINTSGEPNLIQFIQQVSVDPHDQDPVARLSTPPRTQSPPPSSRTIPKLNSNEYKDLSAQSVLSPQSIQSDQLTTEAIQGSQVDSPPTSPPLCSDDIIIEETEQDQKEENTQEETVLHISSADLKEEVAQEEILTNQEIDPEDEVKGPEQCPQEAEKPDVIEMKESSTCQDEVKTTSAVDPAANAEIPLEVEKHAAPGSIKLPEKPLVRKQASARASLTGTKAGHESARPSIRKQESAKAAFSTERELPRKPSVRKQNSTTEPKDNSKSHHNEAKHDHSGQTSKPIISTQQDSTGADQSVEPSTLDTKPPTSPLRSEIQSAFLEKSPQKSTSSREFLQSGDAPTASTRPAASRQPSHENTFEAEVQKVSSLSVTDVVEPLPHVEKDSKLPTTKDDDDSSLSSYEHSDVDTSDDEDSPKKQAKNSIKGPSPALSEVRSVKSIIESFRQKSMSTPMSNPTPTAVDDIKADDAGLDLESDKLENGTHDGDSDAQSEKTVEKKRDSLQSADDEPRKEKDLESESDIDDEESEVTVKKEISADKTHFDDEEGTQSKEAEFHPIDTTDSQVVSDETERDDNSESIPPPRVDIWASTPKRVSPPPVNPRNMKRYLPSSASTKTIGGKKSVIPRSGSLDLESKKTSAESIVSSNTPPIAPTSSNRKKPSPSIGEKGTPALTGVALASRTQERSSTGLSKRPSNDYQSSTRAPRKSTSSMTDKSEDSTPIPEPSRQSLPASTPAKKPNPLATTTRRTKKEPISSSLSTSSVHSIGSNNTSNSGGNDTATPSSSLVRRKSSISSDSGSQVGAPATAAVTSSSTGGHAMRETNSQRMSREAAIQKRKELESKATPSRAFGAGKTMSMTAKKSTKK